MVPTDSPDARRNAQRRQVDIMNEDALLRKLDRTLEEKKKGMQEALRALDALDLQKKELERKKTALAKQLGEAERAVAIEKAKIRKMEQDAEFAREKEMRSSRKNS